MLLSKELKFGDLNIIVYDFEYVGDSLSYHRHEAQNTHITICCKGSVEVITPTFNKVLEAGNIVDFVEGQWHSIKSLEDNSRVINIQKHIAMV